jgi:uncharacterized protein YlzI (FlbEa/FlbD family)
MITIYFVNGESLATSQSYDEIRDVLQHFDAAESMIPVVGGRTLYFNPAHVTHIIETPDV